MSKRLKSFHKLFFIVIFSILFSGVIGSSNSPELPEKIAPELEQIEALPRRTKPAELNIEVTKIKSEPLEEVYIDRENKNIYVDFSKKKEQTLKGVRNAEDLEKKYNLIISEKVQSSGEVIGKGRTKMTTNPQVMAYETAELDGKKMLKISYENEPEKLYISVENNGNFIKIYNLDIKNATNYIISDSGYVQKINNLADYIIQDLEGTDINAIISNLNFGTLGLKSVNYLPIPIIALGPQTGSNGWEFQYGNANNVASLPSSFPRTGVVEADFTNSSDFFKIQLSFTEETASAPEGIQRIERRGSPLTVYGAYGFGANETISAKLKGEIKSSSRSLNEILLDFRNNSSTRRKEFNPPTNNNNQISYVLGVITLNGNNGFNINSPVISYEVPAGQFNQGVENVNYPKIILEKPLLEESLTLNIENTFNTSNSINFVSNGIISTSGVTITSGSNRYFKGLHYDSFITIGANQDYKNINSGLLAPTTVILNEQNDNSKTLNLEVSYKDRFPIFKILNSPKAGTYKLNMKHYDPSKLDRLNYNLTIVVKNDLNLEPSMVKTNNLNEVIIEDDIVSETYKISNTDSKTLSEFGTLTMQQTKVVPSGDLFPLIVLGTRSTWEFTSTDSNKNRADIIANFKSSIFSETISLKMSLAKMEKDPTTAQEIKIGKLTTPEVLSGFGAYEFNSLEKIKVKLSGEIQSTSILQTILSNFRNKVERETRFFPEGDVANQISYAIGQKNGLNYEVPTSIALSSADKNVDSINYPNIRVIKPLLEDKVELKILNGFILNSPIQFTKDGVVVSGVTSTSEKNRYLKSLHYNSSFSINNGLKKEITSDSEKSNSEDYNITLNNGADVLVLKVKYENSRYPKLTILGTPNPGKYTMNMKHFDPSGLERLNYVLDIIIEPKSAKEFEVTSSMRDIIILPDGKIEIPNNWVNVVQLVPEKEIFPVIGINRPSWVTETDRPLNPIDKRPTAVLNLGAKDEIEVPVNIRETPYQNTEKFFVYDRGDMTNRNIAVGAYTSLSSIGGTGLSNKVRVDFQISLDSLSEDDKNKILAYAQDEFDSDTTKTRVIIPYSTTKPEGYHKIYSIRGLQKSTSKIFSVNEDNILSYGVVDFPKIVVLREDKPIEKKAILNLINPIPKTAGDISGTFDIIYGVVSPNNLQGYNHPSSLSVDGITSDWYGFTIIPEHHKVQIKVGGTVVKEFMTAENGYIKGTQNIKVENNEYVLLKGQNAPLAIGIKQWDFNQKKDTIVFEHLNSNNRVVARDIYEINLPIFSPIKYLDATNSSLIAKRGSNKDLTVIANARQDFIELGTLKLQNYQKDITKVGNYNTGTELYENEVRIETILSDLTLESSDKTQLKGTLKFDSNKTSISIPNESATLRFVLSEESKNNANNIAGKTFTIITSNSNPLIKIKGGNNQLESLLEKLTITLKDGQAGKLPNMSFVSTITALTIKENDLGMINKPLPIPGRMTLRQLDGGQGNSVPAIALGLIDDWRVFKGNRNNIINNRKLLETQYTIGNSTTTINLRPELTAPIPSVDDINGTDGVYITDNQIKLYQEKDSSGKILTALTYVTRRNTRTERITTGLAIGISTEQLSIIKNVIKNISGDRIELRATGNNAKIAYIHAKDEGTSGVTTESNPLYIPTANPSLDNSYAYENLPSIFIEKENLYKNMEIKLLPTYNQEKITFTSSNIIEPTGGLTEVIPSNDFRVLEGLSYEHKIRLTLPGGQIKEYTTNNNGGTIEDIVETLEKNGKTVKVHFKYLNDKDVEIWITDRNGSQYYDLVLQHIDPSGDIRRTTNLRLTSQVKDNDAEFGELDFVISSRYNAIDGQLNSAPLIISSNGVTYPKEILDLKLINGNYPIKPDENTKVFVSYTNFSGETKDIEISTTVKEIETSKMKLRFKKNTNGDIEIKPLKWNYNAKEQFTLTYKKDDKITNQYIFNVICPEFFVASSGILDFGRIYKVGSVLDKTAATDIKLEYIDGTVKAKYSLDVSQGNP
ncbi:MAG: hypothetical protein ACRCZO_12940, partial [Cetobacterium sp.]